MRLVPDQRLAAVTFGETGDGAGPMFESAAIRFGDGRTLVIRGKGAGPYVQEVSLNGSQYTSSWLPLSALHAGISRLDFTLAKEPNTQRGKAPADRPPSFMHPQAQ